MARVVIYNGGRRLRDVPLVESSNMIGRDESCPIRLDESVVSRFHAAIVEEDGGWAVHDMESENGLYVNGVREFTRALSSGDRVQVGSYMMLFEAHGTSASATTPPEDVGPPAPDPAAAPQGRLTEADPPARHDDLAELSEQKLAGLQPSESTFSLRPGDLLELRKDVEAAHGLRLVLTTDRNQEVKIPLERRETLLGKGESCHVKLPKLGWGGGKAARVVLHDEGRVELHRESRLCDVRVNEKRVRSCTLQHGDTIQVGSYRLVFLSGL